MNRIDSFFDTVKNQETATLATADESGVTMRTVSPVYFDDSVLIFTSSTSRKYAQLKANPHCCLSVGNTFAECDAEFCGATLNKENEKLRKAYDAKFKGAFNEGVENGGRESEFIMLKPKRLTGWCFENDIPTADGIPNIPFSVAVNRE